MKRQQTFEGKTQLKMKKSEIDDDMLADNGEDIFEIEEKHDCSMQRTGKSRLKKYAKSVRAQNTLQGKCLVHIGENANELYKHAVIYISECTAEHVRGIMINKLLFGTATIECRGKDSENETMLRNVYEDLYQGGPENPAHGYVLFPKEDVSNGDPFAEVQGDIALSTSFGVLQDILDGEGPKKKIIAMGHCEWHRGELEWEIFNNQWLIIPSSVEILFDTALDNRWQRAKEIGGFDIKAIAQVGLA